MTAQAVESPMPALVTPRVDQATLAIVSPDLGPHAELRSCMARFRGRARHIQDPAEALNRVSDFDAAILTPPNLGAATLVSSVWLELISELEARHVATLVVGASDTAEWPATCCVSTSATADELIGRIETALHYRAILRENAQEMTRLKRLGQQLNRHFEELDQEMRLAGRLQRDFLPRVLPRTGAVRFSALYRPATWVSGDIYDVFELDEDRVGFYLADAVGHGVAAGLLTMFIKRSIHSKVPHEGGMRIVPPDESLSMLNDALAGECLPNCQFATACYGIIDGRTLELHLARGGHPYPIHVRRDGTMEEVTMGGGLLGVFAGEEFPAARVQMAPGEKMIIYSDGLEDFFVAGRDPGSKVPEFGAELCRMAAGSAEEIISHIRNSLDTNEGSINPPDDVTVMILEVGDEDSSRSPSC